MGPINTVKSTPFNNPLIAEGNVISVTYTEEDLAGRILWNSFLEDINEEGKFLDLSIGSFDEILLQMEMNFDTNIITGSLSGSTEYDFSSWKNHFSFNGEFTGGIEKYNWDYFSWFWRFGSNFTLSLTCSMEQYYTNEQNEASWNTREVTIQVEAELTGDSFAGNGGIGRFNVKWEDLGTGADDNREFTLHNKHDLRADLPDVIDIDARITGPEIIRNTDSGITFNIDASGVDVDLVKEVNWYFYYYNDIIWEDYRWFESFKNTDFSSLSFSNAKILEWVSYVNDHGKTINDEKKLPMQVYIQVMAGEDQWLFNSEVFNFSYVLEELSDFRFETVDTIDVYPTSANTTELELFYEGVNPAEPVTLKVDRAPAHLKIALSTVTITPSTSGKAIVELTALYDAEKNLNKNYPQEETIKITMKSGDKVYEKNLKVKLLPAKWLIIEIAPTESKNTLQIPVMHNVLEILKAYEENKIEVIDDIEALVPIVYSIMWDVNHTMGLQKGGRVTWFFMENGTVNNKGDYGAKNMGDIASYNEFIEFTKKKVPHEKCMLVINCHGMGVFGLSVETNPLDRLTIKELRSLNGHYDILTFSSCLMGEIEVLYDIKDKADYIIASELVMTAKGLNWEKMLEYLFNYPDASARDFSEKIIEYFEQESMAAVDPSKLNSVVTALDDLSKALLNGYTTGGQEYEIKVKEAVKETTYTRAGMPFIDIMDFCDEIKYYVNDSNVKTEAAKVSDLLYEAIINRTLNPKAPNYPLEIQTLSQYKSLSIFFWKDSLKGDALKIYRGLEGAYNETYFSQETSWIQFIQKYVETSSRNSTTIKLSGDKRLNLHVIDKEGKHLGVNPMNPVNQVAEDEIPGSLYLELDNGDEIIVLPETVLEFDVIIDGNVTSDYTVTYNIIEDDEIISEETSTGNFETHSTHIIPVTTTGGTLTLGDTEITTPEPSETESSGGIPGYPNEAILLGAIIGLMILLTVKKNN